MDAFLQHNTLRRLAVLMFASCLVVGCERAPAPKDEAAQDDATRSEGGSAMSMTVTSTVFSHNEPIPEKYTGDGRDVSPPLSWSGAPDGVKEFALICDDPDAPTAEPWVHWVLYKIPGETTSLPENVAKTESLSSPPGAKQGQNSFGNIGYGGPAPPKGHGVHHYHFKVYALDTAIEISGTADKKRLLNAITGHVVAEGELVGTYERK